MSLTKSLEIERKINWEKKRENKEKKTRFEEHKEIWAKFNTKTLYLEKKRPKLW